MGYKSRNKVTVAFSMSSMTDIVFLLLIFFIILSTMITPNALKVNTPVSDAKTTAKLSLSVSIGPDLSLYVGKDEVTEGMLEATIQDRLRGQEKQGIILHADETVPIENVLNVVQIAERNGYELVLATRAK